MRYYGSFAGHDSTEHLLKRDARSHTIRRSLIVPERYLVKWRSRQYGTMALLDPFNPRSVARFRVNQIDEGISTLPVLRRDGMLEEPRRLTTPLRAKLTSERAESLDDSRIFAVEQELLALANAIAARYFLQGATQGRAEKVTGFE